MGSFWVPLFFAAVLVASMWVPLFFPIFQDGGFPARGFPCFLQQFRGLHVGSLVFCSVSAVSWVPCGQFCPKRECKFAPKWFKFAFKTFYFVQFGKSSGQSAVPCTGVGGSEARATCALDEVVWCILETVLFCAGGREGSAGHRSEKNACCGLPPPSGGRGRVRKPASTRVHVDEAVCASWRPFCGAWMTQALVGCEVVPLQYCGARAPCDKVARSSGVRSS